jgi:hypothetical protein
MKKKSKCVFCKEIDVLESHKVVVYPLDPLRTMCKCGGSYS